MAIANIYLNCSPHQAQLIDAVSNVLNVPTEQIEASEDWRQLTYEREIDITITQRSGEYFLRIHLGSSNHLLLEENMPYKLGHLCELLNCQGITLEYPEHNDHVYWALEIYGRNNYQQVLLDPDQFVRADAINVGQRGRKMTDLSEWNDDEFPVG